MTHDLLNIFGGGEMGQQGYRILSSKATDRYGAFKTVRIFDDHLKAARPTHWEGLQVDACLDFSEWLTADVTSGVSVVGVGYHHLPLRQIMVNELSSRGAILANQVHHSVILADIGFLERSEVGEDVVGVSLYPGVVIDFNVRVRSGVVVNVGARICHDTTVGESSFIGPGVTICGRVNIGQRCFVGAGSTLRNGISIGDDVHIAMGSIVTADVLSRQSVAGNPARVVKSISP